MKPTLAFIDHELHQKTKSSDFLRELFKEHFEVHEYWDASWRGGPTVPPEEINKHDYVFYLQVINPFSDLKRIHIPILWAPMYDSFKPTASYWRMISYFDIKILSFSKKMAEHFKKFDIPTMYVQYYYLKPEKSENPPGNHIFFWYRGGVELSEICQVLDPSQVDSFTFLEAPDKDGNLTQITEKDRELYKIKHMTGFLPREEFLKLVRDASIFVAPRKKEGIGAFTEPLAMGKTVIAFNEGVQNEYITDNVDGLLFDAQTANIDLSGISSIPERAFERASKGYLEWLKEKERIIPFLREPYYARKRAVPIQIWKFFYWYNQFFGSIKYYIQHRFRERILPLWYNR